MIDRIEIAVTTLDVNAEPVRCTSFACVHRAAFTLERTITHSDSPVLKGIERHDLCAVCIGTSIVNQAYLFNEKIHHLRRQRAGDAKVAS